MVVSNWSGILSFIGFPAPEVVSSLLQGALQYRCSLLGIATMKSSFKEDDASCATVYFNCSEENWAESSEIALFNSSEKIEISINCVQDLLLFVYFGIMICVPPLLTMVYAIFCNTMSVIFYCGTAMFFLLLCVYLNCVQLARTVECTEKANVLDFDIKKVVRRFANDLAKEFANRGQKWIASNEGGLVYGRMSAKKDLTDY
ncbi:hypothetical protein V1515DRAFT_636825 [Lipomyces mesembrius]